MIAVIDYGMGNLHSVSKALETVGADVIITHKAEDIRKAQGIVLPGVGSFFQGMEHLRGLQLVDVLNEEVLVKKKQFLGICLGMQLCATSGEEYGHTEGLGWIDAQVIPFKFEDRKLKVPHMGWDDVEIVGDSPLLKGFKSPATFYFVHSYHFVPKERDVVSGTCDYGGAFVASVSKENIHLVQFHPEKSQDKGLQVMENFLDLTTAQVN